MEAEAANPEPASTGVGALKARAGRATAWTLIGYGGSQLLRLASNLLLTRLLLAEHFGLMALVNIFVMGLQLFSDVGIGPAIIQSKRGDDPVVLNTAWTIGVMRGFALWMIGCALAAPFAEFYQARELAYLIPVVSLNAVFMGFSSSKTFTQNRNLALGRVVSIDLASQLIAAIVMIVWALLTHSVWALAAGAMVRAFVQSVLTHAVLPGVSIRFQWDSEVARGLFSFGRWVFISTALTFITGQADRLVFGRLVSMADLGVYSVAALLASAPAAVLSQLNRTIVFPIYSRAHQAGDNLGAIYNSARRPLLIMSGWALSALVVCGPSLVQVLYRSSYWDAGWMIQLLAAGIWFGVVLEGTNGYALLAQGLSKWTAAGSFAKVVGLCVFLPAGYSLGGFPGALVGLAASEICRYFVSIYAARKRQLHGIRQDLKATAMIVLATAGGSLVTWGLRKAHAPALLEAAASFAVVTAVWSPLLVPYARTYLARPRPVGTVT